MAKGHLHKAQAEGVFMIFMVYCIVSLFYDVFVLYPDPRWQFSYS